MAVIFAVFSSFGSGTGDFLGALASRRGRVHAVAAGSQMIGVLAALALSPLVGGSPAESDLLWGAAAGASAALAILALYQGLAIGDVGVVSPIAAVGAAAWPVLYSYATGDTPSAMQAAGLAVGVLAIWLVSQTQPSAGQSRRSVAAGAGLGLVAGAGFGGLFILLGQVGENAGMWPLVPARFCGAVLLVAIAAVTGRMLRPVTGTVWAVVGAGVVTAAGNGMFILAAQRGSLAVVSVLAAMFPATTVVLARIIWHERLGPGRAAGLGLALVAVGLVVAA